MVSITAMSIFLGRAASLVTAFSLARSNCAADGRPTSSSAPTPWCNWARAGRSTPGSTASTSDPKAAAASFT
jgi:hypothetical protein